MKKNIYTYLYEIVHICIFLIDFKNHAIARKAKIV